MRLRKPHLIMAVAAGLVALSAALAPTWSRGANATDPHTPAEGTVNVALAALMQEANEDLDAMAQELAKLVATPGFRGYIRSEITNTKNREGILELDPFLERAARRPDAPQGLAQLREMNQNAKGRIASTAPGATFKGYDLYIPVEAHRTKWRGGDDFVVAFAPLGDDQAVKQITAYSVRTGQKVMLDATKAPDTVVLILVPCEHNGEHETKGQKPPTTNEDRVVPKADAAGKEPAEKPVEQSEGNSHVGLRRMYIRDVKEPWWLGAPEIFLYFAQRKGNYCETKYVSFYSKALEYLDNANTWRTTWSAPGTGDCNLAFGQTCFYFDTAYATKMYVRILEADGGFEGVLAHQTPFVFDLYSGVSCEFNSIYSEDDYIDHSVMYRNNFNFEFDHNHDMGNAFVKWHKVH